MARQNLLVVFFCSLAVICLFYLADGEGKRVALAMGASASIVVAVFLRDKFTTDRWINELRGRPCELTALPEGRYKVLGQGQDDSDRDWKWQNVLLVQAVGHNEERFFVVYRRHDIHVTAGDHFELGIPANEKTVTKCWSSGILLEDPFPA